MELLNNIAMYLGYCTSGFATITFIFYIINKMTFSIIMNIDKLISYTKWYKEHYNIKDDK